MSEIKVHLTVIASDGRMMTKSEARKAEVNNGNGFITTRTKVFNPMRMLKNLLSKKGHGRIRSFNKVKSRDVSPEQPLNKIGRAHV